MNRTTWLQDRRMQKFRDVLSRWESGALSMMAKAREVPKKVRDHHLRQWYVLGDLLDRSGEIVEARRFFGMVAQADAEFADVMQRLAALGR
jgi:hypothetical protein